MTSPLDEARLVRELDSVLGEDDGSVNPIRARFFEGYTSEEPQLRRRSRTQSRDSTRRESVESLSRFKTHQTPSRKSSEGSMNSSHSRLNPFDDNNNEIVGDSVSDDLDLVLDIIPQEEDDNMDNVVDGEVDVDVQGRRNVVLDLASKTRGGVREKEKKSHSSLLNNKLSRSVVRNERASYENIISHSHDSMRKKKHYPISLDEQAALSKQFATEVTEDGTVVTRLREAHISIALRPPSRSVASIPVARWPKDIDITTPNRPHPYYNSNEPEPFHQCAPTMYVDTLRGRLARSSGPILYLRRKCVAHYFMDTRVTSYTDVDPIPTVNTYLLHESSSVDRDDSQSKKESIESILGVTYNSQGWPKPFSDKSIKYIPQGFLSSFVTENDETCDVVLPERDGVCDGVGADALVFESRFECGNLQSAMKIGPTSYKLLLQRDLYTRRHTQWFYFSIENTRANTQYTFHLMNLLKNDSLYNHGMQPVVFSQRQYDEKGIGWHRDGDDVAYFKNHIPYKGTDRRYYTLTFSYISQYDNDTIYFAHCYPYTFSDLQEYITKLTTDERLKQICRHRNLCKSLAGNAVDLLTVTNFGVTQMEMASRKGVVISARVHPGESNSSWMMKGFIDFVTADTPDAHILRENFVFKIVPMMNPDGVIAGNYRCSLAGCDLNRTYKQTFRELYPTVYAIKTMMHRLARDRPIVAYCDLHGHSKKHNVFVYGCNNTTDPNRLLMERVFPTIMSLNGTGHFSLKSSKFSVSKSKEATGRIVTWREHNLINAFTMEATFCGSTMGKMKGRQFRCRDFENLGTIFFDSLLDYCDPDQAKANLILSRLRSEALQRASITRGTPARSLLNAIALLADNDDDEDDAGSDSSPDEGEIEENELRFRFGDVPQERKLESLTKLKALKLQQELSQNNSDNVEEPLPKKKPPSKKKTKKPKETPSKKQTEVETESTARRTPRHSSHSARIISKYKMLSNNGIPTFTDQRIQERKQTQNKTPKLHTFKMQFVDEPLDSDEDSSATERVHSAPISSAPHQLFKLKSAMKKYYTGDRDVDDEDADDEDEEEEVDDDAFSGRQPTMANTLISFNASDDEHVAMSKKTSKAGVNRVKTYRNVAGTMHLTRRAEEISALLNDIDKEVTPQCGRRRNSMTSRRDSLTTTAIPQLFSMDLPTDGRRERALKKKKYSSSVVHTLLSKAKDKLGSSLSPVRRSAERESALTQDILSNQMVRSDGRLHTSSSNSNIQSLISHTRGMRKVHTMQELKDYTQLQQQIHQEQQQQQLHKQHQHQSQDPQHYQQKQQQRQQHPLKEQQHFQRHMGFSSAENRNSSQLFGSDGGLVHREHRLSSLQPTHALQQDQQLQEHSFSDRFQNNSPLHHSHIHRSSSLNFANTPIDSLRATTANRVSLDTVARQLQLAQQEHERAVGKRYLRGRDGDIAEQ
eukprot:m.103392 g.103392  ORF g.103392 m.103392 type:complete len:1433 (+) comp9094_c0_seq2:74-4372(+)